METRFSLGDYRPIRRLQNPAIAAVMLAIALIACGQASAQNHTTDAASAWANCWKAARVPGDTSVDLEVAATGARTGPMTFATDEAVSVTPVIVAEGVTELKKGETVELQEPKGRIVLPGGVVQVTNGLARYVVSGTSSSAYQARFDALPGIRLVLQQPLKKGADGFLIPAGTAGVPVVSTADRPVRAKLAGDALLKPLTTAAPAKQSMIWLDAGTFPVTSRGRSIEIHLHDSGRPAADFGAAKFQACIRSGRDVYPAVGVDLVGTEEGIARLAVWVPPEIGASFTWFWGAVGIAVLDVTGGILTDTVDVRVGNPIFAGLVALILTFISVWLVAAIGTRLVKAMTSTTTTATETAVTAAAKPKPYWAWNWIAGVFRWMGELIDEGEGQKSLALFQILIWTLLVVAGMYYVFFMSGTLMSPTEDVLAVLGIASGSSVIARLINPAPDKDSRKGFGSMFFAGKRPDLTRVQMFIFTVMIWIYVLIRIWYNQVFPDLDANVLLLLGISSGVYVAAKLPSLPPFSAEGPVDGSSGAPSGGTGTTTTGAGTGATTTGTGTASSGTTTSRTLTP